VTDSRISLERKVIGDTAVVGQPTMESNHASFAHRYHGIRHARLHERMRLVAGNADVDQRVIGGHYLQKLITNKRLHPLESK